MAVYEIRGGAVEILMDKKGKYLNSKIIYDEYI